MTPPPPLRRRRLWMAPKWKWWWKMLLLEVHNLALPVGPFCRWPTYGVPWIFAYCSRNHYSKSCKIDQTFRVIIVLVHSSKFQELHVVSLMPPHRVSPPPKTEKWLKLKKKTREMILCTKNGILFLKLFNCEKSRIIYSNSERLEQFLKQNALS